MAPSPVAERQTEAPKTPTKLSKRPAQTPQKPTQPASIGKATPSTGRPTPSAGRPTPSAGKPIPSAGKPAPSTPKASQAAKPETASSQRSVRPEKPDFGRQAKDTAKKAQNQAQSAGDQAKDQVQEAPGGIEMRDDNDDEGHGDDDDNGPMSKVTQAGQQPQEGLQHAEPEPIKDSSDDDGDAVEGAQAQAHEGAEQAGDEAKNIANNAAEKADDTVRSVNGNKQQQESEQAEPPGDNQTQTGHKLTSNARNAAGKASNAANKASQGTLEAAKNLADDSKKDAEEEGQGVPDTLENGVEEGRKVAGETTNDAEDVSQDARHQKGKTENQTGDVADGIGDAEDTSQGATNQTEDAEKQNGDVGGDAEAGQVENAAQGVEGQAKDATDAVEKKTDDVADNVDNQAEDAAGKVEDRAEDGADQQAAEIEIPDDLPVDLSVLEGLEVQEDGSVYDRNNHLIGKLVEGDAEDLAGYPISASGGEIIDDDGDLVGRVELHQDEVVRQLQAAREQGQELPESAERFLDQYQEQDGIDEAAGDLPPLSILEGLTCQVDGLIFDSEGNTVGKVTQGDPQELQNALLNDQGEFVDQDNNIVGYAEIHEDAGELVDQGIYEPAEQAQEAVEEDVEQVGEGDPEAAEEDPKEAGEDVEDQVDGVQEREEEVGEIEDQLPGIEALQGRELNDSGDVIDENGAIIGGIEDQDLRRQIADGELDPNTLKIDGDGNVLDENDQVLGKTELAEGAAERLSGRDDKYDLRILDGLKVNRRGKVLNLDGEEIAELVKGELSECAGKKINSSGDVLGRDDSVLGRVRIVPGEAAENATKQLLEELGELQEEEDEPEHDIRILNGKRVNKRGKILDDEGEVVGELADGELSQCIGSRANERGELYNKAGQLVGHVRVVPGDAAENATKELLEELGEIEGENPEEEQQEEEQEEEHQNDENEQEEDQPDQEEEEEEGQQLPPLSILENLGVTKYGKIVSNDGNVVGELVEGNAKKLWKSGNTCDAEGQFWEKGRVIGRAQTLPQEEPEEEPPFAGLEGLHVVENGWVQDSQGYTMGYITEGDHQKLLYKSVDEDGDILDKKGSVIGRAERYTPEEEEEEQPEEAPDLSFLKGKTCTKTGLVIGDEGIPVARLSEGNAKELQGRKLDHLGQFWNDGTVMGRVELIPEDERESKPEGPFAGLEDLRVISGGKVEDGQGNIVGEIVSGDPKRVIGMKVDFEGDVLDSYGNIKAHAEPLPEEEEEEVDYTILDGCKLNKRGLVVGSDGVPVGRIIEGNAADLAGRQCDEQGFIYNDRGKVAGRCEPLPEEERVARPDGPFAGLEGLRVVSEGKVEDENGNIVGYIVEGDAKRLLGFAVDSDGEITNNRGDVMGRAERWEPEEEEEVDLSGLEGSTISKAGYAIDSSGTIVGRVAEGDLQTMIGKKVDGQGQIWDNGNVIGRCELTHGVGGPDGPFAGLEGLHVVKPGNVEDSSGNIVGRIIEGNPSQVVGMQVDSDGEVVDQYGRMIAKAERWEPEEKERRINPMSGMRVNREGEVRGEDGNVLGKLTSGDLGHCVGQEIDDSGNVVDVDGQKIGEATLLENIVEDEYEGPSEEELEEARKRDEESQIAEKMAGICSQTLERMQPICKQITEYMEKADATPKEDLDEEELVNNVKPLIEEGGRILQECNGSLRGLDPDGHIAAQAKGRSGTGEATPEEHRLAETLKELTTSVVTTIDGAKKKLNNMPHAKKKLNPLWSLMSQPLFQILAAVGLLLAGVLGLVGQLLNGLGLGGLVNGVLGGLGINKLLSSFGLGGDKKNEGKKEGGNKLSSLPIVGGLLGSSK